MRLSAIARLLSLAAVVGSAHAQADAKPHLKVHDETDLALVTPPLLSEDRVAINRTSGLVSNNQAARGNDEPAIIYDTTVKVAGVQSIRLDFDTIVLSGDKELGNASEIWITSLKDGAVQILDAESVKQWQNTSAYFNGDAVRIEIVAYPGTGDNLVKIDEAITGTWNPQAESICGSTDDRTLSNDPRSGRLLPVGCTGWIIDDCEHCFLTAGHCTGSPSSPSFNVVQFNVPLSNPDQSLNHPGPEDQYPLDATSMQTNGGQGTGDDWAYFGVFPNSNTGLRPHQAQGDFHVLGDITPAVGDSIRVTGYGSTSSPVPNEWYLVQKTHAGPFVSISGDLIRYAMDTTGGNSGSAVEHEPTGQAFGIHTHAGCNTVGGNQGTHISHPGLQAALANPLGVCFPRGVQFGPVGQLLHIGQVGGPFNDTSFTIDLDNPTDGPLDYTITILSAEHGIMLDGTAGPISGTLAAGATDTIDAMLVDPDSQPAGIYTTVIEYHDTTNDNTDMLTSVLEVGQTAIAVSDEPGFDGSGPVGGPFAGSSTFTITSERPQPVQVQVTADEPWVSVSPSRIRLDSDGSSVEVDLGVNALAAGSLPAGLYEATVTVNNIQGDMGDTSFPVSLDVGRFVFHAADVPAAIPDDSPAGASSTISIDQAFCIGDVDVVLDISHTFIGDLTVELTSPEGTTVTLHNGSGGSDDNIMTTYDDQAGTPADGPGSLSDFIDEGSMGDWTLFVVDDAGGDVGTINDWSLRIASSGVDCPPAAQDLTVIAGAGVTTDITLQGQSATGLPLMYVIESLPADGDLLDSGSLISSAPHTLNTDTVSYRPDGAFTGLDSFTYRADDGLPSNTATVDIEVGRALVAGENMDQDPGWSAQGDWAHGQPLGIGEDPSAGFTGTNVYGYNLAGDYDNDMPETYLTTPAYDLAGITGAEVRFQRWLAVESSTFDHASFEYSIDGGAWMTLYDHTDGTINDNAWIEQVFDVSDADGQSVRFRWVMGTTDGSVTFGGWNIDDFALVGFVPAAPCLADVNMNGELEPTDFGAWLAAFNAGDPAADQNLDGQITPTDFGAWLANFNAGCD